MFKNIYIFHGPSDNCFQNCCSSSIYAVLFVPTAETHNINQTCTYHCTHHLHNFAGSSSSCSGPDMSLTDIGDTLHRFTKWSQFYEILMCRNHHTFVLEKRSSTKTPLGPLYPISKQLSLSAFSVHDAVSANADCMARRWLKQLNLCYSN